MTYIIVFILGYLAASWVRRRKQVILDVLKDNIGFLTKFIDDSERKGK